MALEIERRFLATPAVLEHCRFGLNILQGYLHTDSENTVRVRRAGGRTFFTWKGRRRGASREEVEQEVPTETGEAMFLGLRPDACLSKVRYRIEHAGLGWDVDVFEGSLSGLILAEVELTYEAQPVILPPWVAREVTLDERYRNSRLARARLPIERAA
ncbi:CYTH domain-containing protein [Methylobacterium sp. BE186]|uniref:CYTH domain-containing protein n=1 Tax=Methylobacterium sp. BE186 TaxID=2817715 RepID=UPI00285DA732|nr:CYTH domain-containing protein [Methylobacterium sp. BE186]MDR7038519.1 CYTH domain-containing protein [Methylobacterium sp. BE186]